MRGRAVVGGGGRHAAGRAARRRGARAARPAPALARGYGQWYVIVVVSFSLNSRFISHIIR